MAETEFVQYITKAGDRWDLIAWDHYGDPHAYEEIVAANPNVPIRPTLAAGLVLRIPVREAPPPAGLPPWKRGG